MPLPGREVVPVFGLMTTAPRVEPEAFKVWFACAAATVPVMGMKKTPWMLAVLDA